jgi:LysM repeat protein
VRQTTAVPGGNNSSAPITTEVHPPQVQPQATVPTRRDLQPPTNATSIVQIGGPTAQQQPQQQLLQQQPAQPVQVAQAPETESNPPITIVGNETPAPQQQTNSVASQQDQQVAGADAPPTNNTVSPTNALAQLAQQHGETLVTMTPTGQQQVIQPAGGTRTVQQQQQPVSLAGMKDYTAQPGDNLSKMAARFMGANTKANRDAIIRANPSLQEDANKVIVDKIYHIPSVGAVSSVQSSPQSQQQTAPVAPQRQPVVTAAATEYWYTVKEGDSLWKIANEQLGNPSALTSIKELNKETLNGDTVVVGQKLRLPGKPVARAN